ncbi:DUF1659 domain-containing protein [Alkalihalobacterium alkalinitrilicum]|uniref:DUF1659 domain-containing protein n=1 Tax=Alkalihalobacterium alkalinitrilicum TaxID=427920 RepID=UPI001303A4F2|nr:DUF1659 domain-containing protein [Alkalihalobacterium alkalinitrilicum]
MLTNSRLVIVFETGINQIGEPILKTKSFNNIKTGASNEQLKAVADALTQLQAWTPQKIERSNTYNLEA